MKRLKWDPLGDPVGAGAMAVATALGAGLVPRAPGTAGTLVAVPLAAWSAGWEPASRLFLWGALLAAGTWAASVVARRTGENDHQSIVVDEVLGYGIAVWTAGSDWHWLCAAFVLFRFFDIWKPFPIRQVDRWSKKRTRPLERGFGVMADDLLAGLFALAILSLFQALLASR